MIDVADAAGVSRATASLVLSGTSLPISPETRQRVIATAQRMGYQANLMAQNLARGRSGMVGATVYSLTNPFYAAVVADLQKAVRSRGYRLIFEVTDFVANLDHRQAIEDLMAWNVEGMILYWNEELEPLTERVSANPNTVLIGSCPLPESIDGVQIALYDGCVQGIRYLKQLGHRRFGYLASGAPEKDGRYRALFDETRNCGLPEPSVIAMERETADEAYHQVQELMRRTVPPTAILCINDMVAVGALHGLRDLRIAVPQQVSLVGFDNTWAARHAGIPLTTVALPVAEMVATAVDFLFERMHGESQERRYRTLTPSLLVRESTAPPDS